MEDLTGKQLGPYQIVAPLGEGGMAAVYKAYQPGMDRYVALKILPRKLAEDPQFVGRFKHEAQILAKLQHPHILPVFDFGEADGYTYIVMPFVESGTLAGLLRGQPLPVKQIRSIISQIGGALNYAHSHGLVHRDVKPSNVLIDETGNCLLTDFGIAKMVEGTAKFTSTGAVIGTPAYMSPEQGRGEKLDGRSDIYSLGIILYEMATGRVPFHAETPVAIIFKHISDPLPLPRATNPALPELVERVILKALAKSAEDRFQTAGEMVEALEGISEIKTIGGTAPTVIESASTLTHPTKEAVKGEAPVGERRRVSPFLIGLGVVVVGVVAGGVWFGLTRIAASGVSATPTLAAISAGATPTVPAEAVVLTVGAATVSAKQTSSAATQIVATALSTDAPRSDSIGKSCLVTGGEVNDSGFYELAWKGVQEAVAQYSAEATYVVSSQSGEEEKSIKSFLPSNCSLIIAVGFQFGDAIKTVAQSNPDQRFQILDYGYDQTPPNLWAQVYETSEAAFLAGYVSASATNTGIVGTFGGMNIQPVTMFMDGFVLGVAHYNEQHGTNIQTIGWDIHTQSGIFTDDFGSNDKGREAGNALMDRGADVIFPVAGVTGYGAADAALKKQGVYMIGVDNDWAVNLPQYSSITLTSVEKRLNLSVISAAKAIADGSFEGGNHVGTLENGETGISPFHDLDALVSNQVKTELEQITADIVAGKIKTRP